jgi:hypothetical protein
MTGGGGNVAAAPVTNTNQQAIGTNQTIVRGSHDDVMPLTSAMFENDPSHLRAEFDLRKIK